MLRRRKLLNKVVIFIFFAHKKYSHRFVKLGWTTDVTWTILTTFLGLERGSTFTVWVRELSDFIKNILISVPKMNNGLTGLVLGVSNYRTFILGELSL